jgi:NADH:ubiquinone oxidoreductase subunit 5 (subunit L)/multisubunit Na+/H+ antiporter MnhA subunit
MGDLITFLISGALIYTMHNQGASRKVVIKMMMNSTLDAVIGAIPLVGTFFDVFYRSNERNVKLLKEHYYEGKHQGSGNGLLLVIVVVCVLIVAAAFYGTYKLFEAIF